MVREDIALEHTVTACRENGGDSINDKCLQRTY